MIRDISKGITTYVGLSTDTKPTGDANGQGMPEDYSFFFETDTEDIYYFKPTDHQWHKLGT